MATVEWLELPLDMWREILCGPVVTVDVLCFVRVCCRTLHELINQAFWLLRWQRGKTFYHDEEAFHVKYGLDGSQVRYLTKKLHGLDNPNKQKRVLPVVNPFERGKRHSLAAVLGLYHYTVPIPGRMLSTVTTDPSSVRHGDGYETDPEISFRSTVRVVQAYGLYITHDPLDVPADAVGVGTTRVVYKEVKKSKYSARSLRSQKQLLLEKVQKEQTANV